MPVPEHVDAFPETFLTALEAAAQLGVNERTIRRAIARGELRAMKRSGSFHISPADLERFRHIRERSPMFAADPSLHAVNLSPVAGPLPAHRTSGLGSLPAPRTSLVGRDAEIADVVATLRGPDRLLTLTGPGGVGKTRLALAAAAVLVEDFASGVRYVSLAAITDPDRVASEIADALGVQQAGDDELADRLVASVRERQMLLVLDNFEPVIEAAELIATLLSACPSLKVLVTSRIRLRLSGECERPVSPLQVFSQVNDIAEHRSARQAIITDARDGNSPAVRLFIERAHAVRPGVVTTAQDAALVAAICQRLDGLPLGIELAAARVNVLLLPDLLARLERRLPLLTGGPRDAPARLRTMRDAIGWSYDLLDRDERRFFRSLAIFAGGFTLAAAEGIATPEMSVFDLLASLVDKSLLAMQGATIGETRYSLLETVREFGLEQLTGHGERDAVAEQHARWYLAFSEDAGPRAKRHDAAIWLPRLQAEHANLLAALAWWQQQGAGEKLLRMAAALWPFWQEQNHFAEGLRWLEPALEAGRDAPAPVRLRALAGAGTLAWYLTQVERATAWHEQALDLARSEGDRIAEARALCDRSWLLAESGDLDAAIAFCSASLELARVAQAPDPMALVLHNLACFSRMQGDLASASRYAAEALALARREGWEWLVTMILVGFGYTRLELGEVERAADLLREALELGARRGDLVDVNTALEGLANVAVVTGRSDVAVRVFGAASALRDEIVMPMAPTERAYFLPLLEGLRDTLGEARFVAAWSMGRSWPPDRAITEALALPVTPVLAEPHTPQLTGRERDVLRELAAGRSNREISEALYISPTTVATHIASLYRKLGVDSRAEAIAWAHRHEFP